MNNTIKMIRTNFKILMISTIIIAFASSCGNTANIGGKATSHWVMLASREIEFVGSDGMDAMAVSDKGNYQQLRFKVDNRGTTLKEITVTYFDGSQQEVKDINGLMAPGQYSKGIILPGTPKRISRIEYKYGAGTGGGGKGMIRIYGYKEIKP